jgi:hypothetical protein
MKENLGLPSTIAFPISPVHYRTLKTILALNKTKSLIVFELTTEDPFSIYPNEGQLKPGESVQIGVTFYPNVCYIFNVMFFLVLYYL